MRTLASPTRNGRPLAEAAGTPVVGGKGAILTGDTRQSNRNIRRAKADAQRCDCRKRQNRYLDRLMAVVDARLASFAQEVPNA